MALAGRAAEQVTFGRVTTGAANDLQRVTQVISKVVKILLENKVTTNRIKLIKKHGVITVTCQMRSYMLV